MGLDPGAWWWLSTKSPLTYPGATGASFLLFPKCALWITLETENVDLILRCFLAATAVSVLASLRSLVCVTRVAPVPVPVSVPFFPYFFFFAALNGMFISMPIKNGIATTTTATT